VTGGFKFDGLQAPRHGAASSHLTSAIAVENPRRATGRFRGSPVASPGPATRAPHGGCVRAAIADAACGDTVDHLVDTAGDGGCLIDAHRGTTEG